MSEIKPINILKKFSLFHEKWTPKIIGELNNQHVKICKLQGNFVWHSHENEDELFLVIKGTLYIDFRNQKTVKVREGEIIIIPKGVEHRPYTKSELVFNLLFEPKTTLHTGDLETDMTVRKIEWI
tara:strand:- start:2339 stop:2713 length:375 start_codon:yes stop_codon:yes gene_type:complete